MTPENDEKENVSPAGGNEVGSNELLSRAISRLLEIEGENDFVYESLSQIPEEDIFCSKNCENMNENCIIRFLLKCRD